MKNKESHDGGDLTIVDLTLDQSWADTDFLNSTLIIHFYNILLPYTMLHKGRSDA